MDVGRGGSFREHVRHEGCMSGVRRASRPLRTQGTEKPPAPRSLLRRANHTPPGRLWGVRQRGGLVSSHGPESQRPTRERCSRARSGFWGKEQTVPRAESFQTRQVLRPLPAYAQGDAGGPCGPGCLPLTAAVLRWGSPAVEPGTPGRRAGREGATQATQQQKPRAGLACRGHDPFCRKILRLQYKWG